MSNEVLQLSVALIRTVADGIVLLTLRRADDDATDLPPWQPGAHIDVTLPNSLTRQYSLCGDPRDAKAYQIAILRERESRGGSHYIHDIVKAGDVLAVGYPRNNFRLAENATYRFVAGGIGITPLLPMIAAAHAEGVDWRLLYGGRSRGSMAFLPELERYEDRVEIRPEDEYGLLDLSAFLAQASPGTFVYCCGPEALLTAVERICLQLPGSILHVERFKAPESDPSIVSANTEFEVELQQSNVVITVPADQSIAQAIEARGIAVAFSCMEGLCGTCETPVIAGLPDHRDAVLSNEEKASNHSIMICVSRALSKRLVLDL